MVQLLVMSIRFISEFLNPVPQGILVMAPELQERFVRYKGEKGTSSVHLYSSDLHLDLVPQEILVMAPEIARGFPLPVYMNF